jgi:hypothetical protein
MPHIIIPSPETVRELIDEHFQDAGEYRHHEIEAFANDLLEKTQDLNLAAER